MAKRYYSPPPPPARIVGRTHPVPGAYARPRGASFTEGADPEVKQEVLEALTARYEETGRPVTAPALAAELGAESAAVEACLTELVASGEVEKVDGGYKPVAAAEPVPAAEPEEETALARRSRRTRLQKVRVGDPEKAKVEAAIRDAIEKLTDADGYFDRNEVLEEARKNVVKELKGKVETVWGEDVKPDYIYVDGKGLKRK